MNSPILIGIGAGLVSAVLFASTMTGSVLAVALFYVTAMPGFLAGLGWGTTAAVVAAMTGTAFAGAVFTPVAGLGYFLTLGLPISILCYLALLGRPAAAASAPGDNQTPAMEWYPAGRIIACTAIMAGGAAALAIPMFGTDIEAYRSNLKEVLESTFFKQLPPGLPEGFSKDDLGPVMELLIRALPAATAIIWFAVMLLNMWTAGRIATVSGRSIRPWPDFSRITYPPMFSLGFVASLLGTFAPGILSVAATGFAGAFLAAYVVMGLVVLHVMAGQTAFKYPLLGVLYIGMFLFGWVALIVAVVGIGDPVLKFRQRAFAAGQPPDKDT